jgi:hypothetical protein
MRDDGDEGQRGDDIGGAPRKVTRNCKIAQSGVVPSDPHASVSVKRSQVAILLTMQSGSAVWQTLADTAQLPPLIYRRSERTQTVLSSFIL